MICVLVGAIFLIFGVVLSKFPANDINGTLGYKTPMSSKNQETWDEAQRQSGKSMIILGLVSIVLGSILWFAMKENITFSMHIQMLICSGGIVTMIICDEIHLRKIFNKDGSRKINIDKNV